jgi:hypothetical protein
MKFINSVFITLVLAASAPVFAIDQPVVNIPQEGDYMADVALRPAGFIGTLVGTGLYLMFTPLTAVSAINPPHDAFQKLADILVIAPAKFTFTRPVGDYNFPQTKK